MPDDPLVTLAADIAREAGALLVERLPSTRVTIDAKSSPTDLVSEVDRESERLIVDRLRAARPDDAVLAEEGTADSGRSGLRWVVDPLDGTINYLYRRGDFSVSIAVEDVDGAVAGVVYDPVRDELFAAVRGAGATRDGEPIAVSVVDDLALSLVATGFAYDARVRALQAQALTRILPSVRDIRRGGAATLDWCGLACGRVDAFYERGLAPWDHAAGALIAAEAGAVVGGPDGGPVSSLFAFGAAPGIADAFRDLLVDAGAVPPAGPDATGRTAG